MAAMPVDGRSVICRIYAATRGYVPTARVIPAACRLPVKRVVEEGVAHPSRIEEGILSLFFFCHMTPLCGVGVCMYYHRRGGNCESGPTCLGRSFLNLTCGDCLFFNPSQCRLVTQSVSSAHMVARKTPIYRPGKPPAARGNPPRLAASSISRKRSSPSCTSSLTSALNYG